MESSSTFYHTCLPILNLRHCPIHTKCTNYKSMVHSIVEYPLSPVWDSYTITNINKLEAMDCPADDIKEKWWNFNSSFSISPCSSKIASSAYFEKLQSWWYWVSLLAQVTYNQVATANLNQSPCKSICTQNYSIAMCSYYKESGFWKMFSNGFNTTKKATW